MSRLPLKIAVPKLEDAARFQRFAVGDDLSEKEYFEVFFEGVSWSGTSANGIAFETVVFKSAKLARATMRDTRLLNVAVSNSDFANADWRGAAFERVEMTSTRLTGFNGSEGKYRHAVFRQCSAQYAVFQLANFDGCRFEECDLSSATFEGATLWDITFLKCNLSSSRFTSANLADVDLRGSRIEGIQIDLKSLQGVRIDPSQTITIAALTGAKIDTLD